MTMMSHSAGVLPATGAARRACAHCGLDVPAALVRDDLEHQFCCHGCQTVYQTINSCGLADYYRLRDATTNERIRPEVPDHAFAEFDDPAFRSVYVKSHGDTCSIDLLLENVHCAACVWLVERLPQVLSGVIEARLNMRRRVLSVRFDPQVVALSRVASMLTHLGYRPHPARGINARAQQLREERRMLARIAIAGFCAGNVMLLAFALYGGEMDTIEPRFEQLFRWMSMLIAAVSLVWPGSIFYRGAIASVRARVPHLDLPIAIALSLGGLWGCVNTIRGSGEIFFDSLTVLTFLLLVGRFIQQRQQRAASDQVELLYALTPSSARLVTDKGVREVPIDAIRVGDIIEVGTNASVPADGTIALGTSSVNTALLTGESAPRPVHVGDAVAAGTINITAPIQVQVEATGTETRVGRLMRLVADAADTKAPIVTLANRIAIVFTVVVVALAAATFAIWLPRGVDAAAEHAIALLIVTCPCALGLATPMAMTSTIGRAARSGIMIKGGAALESLSRPSRLVLDKTGTVTEGALAVEAWHGPEELKSIVATIERSTTHPVAVALSALDPADAPCRIEKLEHVPGQGMLAEAEGRSIVIGAANFVASHTSGPSNEHVRVISEALDDGKTCIGVGVNGVFAAVAVIADQVRADSAGAIAQLQSQGWSVALLSGDDPAVTRSIAAAVGIRSEDATSGATPEQKLGIIKQASGPVVMVGDGVNDAAALAAATVGIAVHGGAEASLEAADIYLTQPGLTPILTAIRFARSARGTILLGMGVSLTYNATAAALAMTGHMSALLAAIIMPISSLTVVAIASRAGSGIDRQPHRIEGRS